MSAGQSQQQEPLQITVHVRDKDFEVFCGAGNQKIRWLSDVALHRFQHFYNQDPGLAMGMRYESGNEINMDMTIFNELANKQHVWVILKEDKALEDADPASRVD